MLTTKDIEALKRAGIWTQNDKVAAITTMEQLILATHDQAVLLKQALTEIDRLRQRLAWYRKMTIKES